MNTLADLSNSVDKVQYSKPEKNEAKSFAISRATLGAGAIELVCPHMRVHYNVKSSENKSYIVLELDNSTKEFYEFLTMLEKRILSVVYTNSEKWFGKAIPFNNIEEFYSSFIRFIDGCPTIRITLSEAQKEEIKRKVAPDDFVQLHIKYTGLLIYKGRFMDEWTLVQLVEDKADDCDAIMDTGEYELRPKSDYSYEYDEDATEAEPEPGPEAAAEPAAEAEAESEPAAEPEPEAEPGPVAAAEPRPTAAAVRPKRLIYGSDKKKLERIIK